MSGDGKKKHCLKRCEILNEDIDIVIPKDIWMMSIVLFCIWRRKAGEYLGF